jgi:hypothetical protein
LAMVLRVGSKVPLFASKCLIETSAIRLSKLLNLSSAGGFELFLCGEPFVAALDWSVCCTTYTNPEDTATLPVYDVSLPCAEWQGAARREQGFNGGSRSKDLTVGRRHHSAFGGSWK